MVRSTALCRPNRPYGFTLVEVMISIAIALILILGISQIFSMAQRTTGGGMAVLTATASNRGALSTLTTDFRNMTNGTDSPALVIVSYPLAAFRNRPDQLQNLAFSAGNPDPRVENDPLNPGSSVALTDRSAQASAINSRIHRLDRIVFSARGLFGRQTGDAPNITSATTAREAFVSFGHLAIPNNVSVAAWTNRANKINTLTYYNPGDEDPKNNNNRYASDWILGREVMLLVQRPNTMIDPDFYPGPPLSQSQWRRTTAIPMSLLRPAKTIDGSDIWTSRYDLVGTSIDQMYKFLSFLDQFPTVLWWQDLSGVTVNTTTGAITSDRRYAANPFLRQWRSTSGVPASTWMSAAAAQSYPVFVRGCTQFIVEYAGDFFTQDVNGNNTAATPDGEIDYVIDNPSAPTAQQARHVRWYGFPRDTNGDGLINKFDGTNSTIPFSHDVVPARDIMGTPLYFERAVPPPATGSPPDYSQNYPLPAPAATGPEWGPAYVCAWGPDTDAKGVPRPKMIRITMTVDDPTGHLNTEQTYQYVFTLP